MVEQLEVPETIAFQDRENQGYSYPYWIAQTVDTGNGSCVVKQCTERETINGICFTPSDDVLAKWQLDGEPNCVTSCVHDIFLLAGWSGDDV